MAERRRMGWAAAACLAGLLGFCCTVRAEVDKEQGDIQQEDIANYSTRWALDSEGKLFSWTLNIYLATTGLKNDHVRASGTEADPDNPVNCAHRHYFTQDMKSAFSSSSTPTTDQVNAYWDERFRYCTSDNTPVVIRTCHEYALRTSSHATGTYEYVLEDVGDVLTRDLRNLGVESNQVSV